MKDLKKNVETADVSVEQSVPVQDTQLIECGIVFLARDVSDGSVRVRYTIGCDEDAQSVERMGRRQGEEPFASWDEFVAHLGELAKAGIISSRKPANDTEKDKFGDHVPLVKCSDQAQIHWNKLSTTPYQTAAQLLKNRPNISF